MAQPSFVLDFSNEAAARASLRRISTSRTSVATEFNSSGDLQEVPANWGRIEYDPATYEALGLLVYEQRTNLLQYSSEFDNAYYTKNDVTISANATTAPDGTASADKIVEAATTAQHNVRVANVSAAAGRILYAFAKADERDRISVSSFNTGTGPEAVFNLTSASVERISQLSNEDAGLVNVGNGWYLCWLYTENTSTGRDNYILSVLDGVVIDSSDTYAGDGTSGLYVWGGQVEVGSAYSSHIATSGSTATRTADDITSTIGDDFNNTEFTVKRKGRTPRTNPGSNHYLFSYDDGTANNRIECYRNSSNEIHVVVIDGGVSQADITAGTVADDTDFSLVCAFKENAIAVSLDGAAVVTDTSATIPTVTTERLGMDYNNANHWNSTILYAPRYDIALLNSEVVELAA